MDIKIEIDEDFETTDEQDQEIARAVEDLIAEPLGSISPYEGGGRGRFAAKLGTILGEAKPYCAEITQRTVQKEGNVVLEQVLSIVPA